MSHHIEEEEEKILPAIEQLSREQQLELGSAFVRERAAILCAGMDSLSRDQLEQQAQNEGITGVRHLNVAELSRAVAAE